MTQAGRDIMDYPNVVYAFDYLTGSMTSGIQEALNTLDVFEGGMVIIPPGDWYIDSPILVLRNNVVIKGYGTATRLLAGRALGDFFTVSGMRGVTFKDMVMDAGPDFVVGQGIDAINIGECIFENLIITRVLNAISLNTSDNNIIRGCICYDCQHMGIDLLDASRNIIAGCVCRNNGQDGAVNWDGIQMSSDITGCTYNIIMDNHCNDDQGVATQRYGISEDAAVDDYNVLIGNTLDGNATAPHSLLGTHTISHNRDDTFYISKDGDLLWTAPNLVFTPAGYLQIVPGTFIYLGSLANALRVYPDGRVELIGTARVVSDLVFDGGAPRAIQITNNNLVLETITAGDIVFRPVGDINHSDAESINFRIENRTGDPAGLGVADAGRMWFDTDTSRFRGWNGTDYVNISWFP